MRDDLSSFPITDQPVNVIRGDPVIQPTQAKLFPGLKMPVDPRLTITSKLQEKLPLVKGMGQGPILSSSITPLGYWVSYEWRAELCEATFATWSAASRSSAPEFPV